MRSRLLSGLTLLLAGLALTGCAAALDPGPKTTEERELVDVDVVELDTGGSLHVTLGETPSLTVTAGEKVIDSLTAEVHAGVLRLGTDGEPLAYAGEIRYELTVTSLSSITVLGSGDADVDFTGTSDPVVVVKGSGSVDATGVDAESLSLTMDGSGSISVDGATAEEITVRVEGSGGVSIDGTAARQDAEIRGSGDYSAAGLDSADARVVVLGSGMADVSASASLDAVIDGSGEIAYTGDPRLTEKIEGSGDVIRR